MVWIDTEKAYDKVWKDELRLKLQKSGVTGCMYQWISQYQTNRKARVHLDGTYSRKKTPKNEFLREVSWALPYSLALSTTLSETCLVKSWVPYTPMILSCGAQRNTFQLQSIDCSMRLTPWKVGQNSGLSESTQGRPATPFSAFQQRNRRPTWISTARLCLLRTTPRTWGWLSTTSWPGNNKPKWLKPEPRCNLPLWRNCQARHGMRILWLSRDSILVESDQYLSMAWQYGALQPSPTLIGSAKHRTSQPASSQGPWSQRWWWSCNNHRALATWWSQGFQTAWPGCQLKRPQDHPMRQRLSQPTKGRLKRESFIHQSSILERDRTTSMTMTPKRSPPPPPTPSPFLAVPAWSEGTSPIIWCTIPGVSQKDSQSGPERKSLTQEYLETHDTKESWTHVYTDGSVENPIQNGGAGVKEDKISLATGLYTTNYKAEAEVLKTAAALVQHSCFSQCCPPCGCLVRPAGPPVK